VFQCNVLHLISHVELDAIHAGEFTLVNDILQLFAVAWLNSSEPIDNLRVDPTIETDQYAAEI
jgi:hypothetical protein